MTNGIMRFSHTMRSMQIIGKIDLNDEIDEIYTTLIFNLINLNDF